MPPTSPLYLSEIGSEVRPDEGHSKVKHGDLFFAFLSLLAFSRLRMRIFSCWQPLLPLSNRSTFSALQTHAFSSV